MNYFINTSYAAMTNKVNYVFCELWHSILYTRILFGYFVEEDEGKVVHLISEMNNELNEIVAEGNN